MSGRFSFSILANSLTGTRGTICSGVDFLLVGTRYPVPGYAYPVPGFAYRTPVGTRVPMAYRTLYRVTDESVRLGTGYPVQKCRTSNRTFYACADNSR